MGTLRHISPADNLYALPREILVEMLIKSAELAKKHTLETRGVTIEFNAKLRGPEWYVDMTVGSGPLSACLYMCFPIEHTLDEIVDEMSGCGIYTCDVVISVDFYCLRDSLKRVAEDFMAMRGSHDTYSRTLTI